MLLLLPGPGQPISKQHRALPPHLAFDFPLHLLSNILNVLPFVDHCLLPSSLLNTALLFSTLIGSPDFSLITCPSLLPIRSVYLHFLYIGAAVLDTSSSSGLEGQRYEDNEIWPITSSEVFWRMPEQPHSAMASTSAELPPPDQPGMPRSSSDSVVVSSRRPRTNNAVGVGMTSKAENHNVRHDNVAVHTLEQGTLFFAMRASTLSNLPTHINKARHQLRLPSFHALGIANPFPTSIPTPPDEPILLDWASSGLHRAQATPTSVPSVPVVTQSSNTPQSPFLRSLIHMASNDTPTQGAVGSFISPSVPSAQSQGSGSSDSSTATEVASNMPWLDGTIAAIGTYIVQIPLLVPAKAKLSQCLKCHLPATLQASSLFSITLNHVRFRVTFWVHHQRSPASSTPCRPVSSRLARTDTLMLHTQCLPNSASRSSPQVR